MGRDGAGQLTGSCVTLYVYVLGRFRLFRGGVDLRPESWDLQKAVSLLKYLVSEQGRWVPSDVFVELFWPDADPERGRNVLRTTFHRLRHSLEPDLPPYGQSLYLAASRGRYRFREEAPHWCDFEEILRLASGAREARQEGRRADAIDMAERALGLYTGDFLAEDPYEDWTVLWRERLWQQHVDLVLQLSEDLRDHPKGAERAIPHLRATVARAPEREDVQRELIWHLAASGNPGEALRQYERLRQALHEEFGVEPTPETRRLCERIRNGEVPAAPLPQGPVRDARRAGDVEPLERRPGTVRSPGAFVAGWWTFRQVVQLERRRLQRWSTPVTVAVVQVGSNLPGIASTWDEAERLLDQKAARASEPSKDRSHTIATVAPWQRRLAAQLRQGDVVCPVDETRLLVLLPHADEAAARRIVNRIAPAPDEGPALVYHLFSLAPLVCARP